MKIVCSKNILNEAVTPALYAVSSKNTNQALDGFLLTADKGNGELTICGYDLEKGIKVTLSGENIQIIESGKIIINAAKFSSIIRNLPEGDVSISADDNFSVLISGARSEFTIHGLDGESFPLMPELKGEQNFKISRKILKNMIVSTNFAVAVNNSRPSLNGALIEIKNSGFNIIAVDGYRLALRRSFDGIISEEGLDLSFIIPGKSLSELLKLIGDEDEPVEIELTKKHVIISFDNIIYFSRLIESEFLDYRRTIKTDPRTTVVIDTKSFTESVERASLLTDDKNKSPVRLNFKKEEVNIENKDDFGILKISSTSLMGKVFDECDIEIYGDELEIGFNNRYLLDALKAVREEKIILKLESPTKSLIILPYEAESKDGEPPADVSRVMDTENSKFLYLVLPVRIRD
ncbi:MAG: DNA polymerase III subunit beta [Oscillospiraceae bacterium]|nr:DNA polymerase III subunit beta [Oscillospiraceae bacterium]